MLVKDEGEGSFKQYDGNYTTDGVKYANEYVIDYIKLETTMVDSNPVVGAAYLDDDGKLKAEVTDKQLYLLNSDETVIRYIKNGSVYQVDPAGDYIAKYSIDENGNKIAKVEYVVNYFVSFDKLTDSDGDGVNEPLTNADGSFVTRYVAENNGSYELREYEVDASGFVLDDNNDYKFTVLQSSCQLVMSGTTPVNYAPFGKTYKEDASGVYVGVYELDSNGVRKQQNVVAYDEHGNPVIDNANSTIIIADPRKDTTSVYTFTWKITRLGLDTPYVDSENPVLYTGGVIKLADYLKEYDSDVMEITQNGTATELGTYTAVIKLTSDNYYWNANPELDYVTVVWTVEKGKLDLSKVTWKYSWKNKEGDPEFPEYTRKEGKAQTYWVELDGIPEAIKGNVVYTTNGKEGAYAGRNAGKYETYYKFVGIKEENYEEILWPENLEEKVVWYINKKKLDMPEVNQTLVVFNDEVHDVLKMLNLFQDWNEYCDIKVEYAADFLNYVNYDGYDNGNGKQWNLVYGAGAYRFTITIKSEINTNPNNPSVVWLKNAGGDDNENLGDPLTLEFRLNIQPELETEEPEYSEEYYEYEEEYEEQYEAPDEMLYDGEDVEEGEDGEGEEPETPEPPKEPDEGNIADPGDDDRDEKDEIVLEIEQITMTVGKLIIRAEDWQNKGTAGATLKLNYNPYGSYASAAEVEKIVKAVLGYEIWDINGNVIPDPSADGALKPGHTYFVHPVLAEKYAQYIEIEYGTETNPVKRNHDFYVEFTDPNPYERIDKPGTTILIPQEYTGEEITFILDILSQYPGYLQIVETLSSKGGLTQVNAGKYYVTLSFRDEVKACWNTSSGVIDRSTIEITFEIAPKKITFPTQDLGEIVYTGLEIDIIAELEKLGLSEYVIIEPSSDDKEINVGDYKVILSINPKHIGNVVWGEGITLNPDGRTLTVTWKITQGVIGGKWNDLGRLTIESETYKGGTEGKIEYRYYTDASMTEEYRVDVTSLKVGTKYWVRAVLLDEVNLRWVEGFQDTYEFTLSVELIWLAKPEILRDKISYTGQEITFEIREFLEKYEGNIEIVAGSLTQINVGKYSVTIRIINDAAAWEGTGSTDEVTLTFEITKAILSGEWVAGSGTLKLSSSYLGSYDKVVKYVYTTLSGEVIEDRSKLVKGEEYIVTVTLLDTDNFEWAPGQELSFRFTYTVDIEILVKPTISITEYVYTGSAITFEIKDWETKYSAYLEIVDGGLRFTDAGDYYVTLRIIGGSAEWEGGGTETITLKFSIKAVILRGSWGNDGKVQFEANSYRGSYDDVVEYVYTNSSGVEVSISQLVEGETYTATIRLKEGAEKNFVFADDFEKTYTFTYEAAKGFKLSWWAILLIVIAIILIILIIIMIIVIQHKKQRIAMEEAEEAMYEASGAYNDYDDTDDSGYSSGDSGDYYGGDEAGTGDGGDYYGETTDEGDTSDYGGGDFTDGSSDDSTY